MGKALQVTNVTKTQATYTNQLTGESRLEHRANQLLLAAVPMLFGRTG